MLKLKLFSLVDAYVSHELVGPCKCDEGDTYAKLIPLLEGVYIVESISFFDVKSTCRVSASSRGSI